MGGSEKLSPSQSHKLRSKVEAVATGEIKSAVCMNGGEEMRKGTAGWGVKERGKGEEGERVEGGDDGGEQKWTKRAWSKGGGVPTFTKLYL